MAGDEQNASVYGAMRALVTGGAGFIGSHLADALLERGAQVAVLDSLATGRRENVAPGAEFFEADLRDRDAVLQAVGRFRPTHIFHQAAQASVKVSVDDPLLDAHVNVIGGLHLLEAAREAGVKRFVFASTGGALYGEVPDGRAADEGRPLQPKSPYGAGKAAFELYLDVYRQNFGLSYTVLRYANVYGPRQDPFGEAGVVAIFTSRLLRGEPVTLFARKNPGDDGCVRDYVYVGDVV
ncbi:MAG: NAD-dependent epimerase/dehydratase family protein, partial [Limnochordales bacterium]